MIRQTVTLTQFSSVRKQSRFELERAHFRGVRYARSTIKLHTFDTFSIFSIHNNQYSFVYFAFFISDVHKVHCSEDWMNVDIALPDGDVDARNVYLEGMKGFPNPKCQPKISGQIAQFSLPLVDFFECGVTRVRKWTVRFLAIG